MTNYIASVRTKMLGLSREHLVQAIAMSINELTLLGRYHYNAPDALQMLQQVNEAINRLSGHLRDLCDPNEPYTPGRADGIAEQLEILPDTSLIRIFGLSA